jgi:hypothetical protein
MPQPIPALVRRYRAADREQVLALAPRLTEGVAAWRSSPWRPGRPTSRPGTLYAGLGFLDEDVRLTKPVAGA